MKLDENGVEVRLPTEQEQTLIDRRKEKLFKDGIPHGVIDTFEQASNYLDAKDEQLKKDIPLTAQEKVELKKGINIVPERQELAKMIMHGLAVWARGFSTTLSINKRELIEEILIRRAIYQHSYELIAKTRRLTIEKVKELEREGLDRVRDALMAERFKV